MRLQNSFLWSPGTTQLTFTQFRVHNQPNMYVCWLWEETRILGRNPHSHGENVQNAKRQAVASNWTQNSSRGLCSEAQFENSTKCIIKQLSDKKGSLYLKIWNCVLIYTVYLISISRCCNLMSKVKTHTIWLYTDLNLNNTWHLCALIRKHWHKLINSCFTQCASDSCSCAHRYTENPCIDLLCW